MPARPEVGAQIRRARQLLDMRQQDLADKLGVSRNTVAKWETDQSYPQRKQARLEQVLGIRLDGTAMPEEPRDEWDRWERYVMNLPHLSRDVAAAIVTDARRARDEHLARGRAAPSGRSPSPVPDRAPGRHRAAG
jgi:transcriptional regulator with XRE-family HTH domain